MKYSQESWTIRKLVQLHGEDKIILNPPYQRNPVWTLKAQKMLVETIKRTRPMPNFFVTLKDNCQYEIVDGQQRARTIIGYWKGFFKDFDGAVFSDSCRYPRASPWHFFTEQASLDLNPGSPAT